MNDTQARLEKLFAGILEIDKEKVTKNKDADIFSELKIDSLLGLELIAAVEREFNIKIEDEEVGTLNTFNAILDIIRKKSTKTRDGS